MATSGSFNTSSYNTGSGVRYLTFSWSRTSYSVENNTSTISYTLKGAGGYSGYVNTRNIKLVINGTIVYQTGTDPIQLRNGTVVKSGTITIYHNSDGTKSFSASAEAGIYYGAVNCTGSGTWSLDAIPRKSSVSATNGDIGKKSTITISRASASFTHTLTWSCLGLSGTIATKTTATSVDFNIPTSLYAKIPNDPSATVTITCETFNGTTSLGSNTCTFSATANEDECKPTLSYDTILDVNEKSKAITKDNKKFIMGVSNAEISNITVAPKNGAYIESVQVINGEQTEDVNIDWMPIYGAIYGVKSSEFKVVAKDSRGYTTTLTYKAEMYEYYKPLLVASVQRVAQTGNTVQVTYRGSICKSDLVTGADLYYRYIKEDGEYSKWLYILRVNPDNNLFYGSADLDVEFDYRKEHTIEFKVVDILDEATYPCTLIRGVPTFDWGQNDFNFNVPVFYKGEEITVDFIVEQGTDGIWTYEKWHSGKAKCWGAYTLKSVVVESAWGYLFESASGYQVDFPYGLFIDSPIADFSVPTSTGGVLALETMGETTKTQTCSLYPVRATPATIVSMTIGIKAVGRWK